MGEGDRVVRDGVGVGDRVVDDGDGVGVGVVDAGGVEDGAVELDVVAVGDVELLGEGVVDDGLGAGVPRTGPMIDGEFTCTFPGATSASTAANVSLRVL